MKEIKALLLVLSILFILNSCTSVSCSNLINRVNKMSFSGKLDKKYLNKSGRYVQTIVIKNETYSIPYYGNAYDYAEIGDSIVKSSGENSIYIIREGKTKSFPAICGDIAYK